MKKVVIGGVVTIAVAVVAVGFGFSFFVSSKIDEILTQLIEVEGGNFQSGQVVTSMGFLETRKIIRNSKLTPSNVQPIPTSHKTGLSFGNISGTLVSNCFTGKLDKTVCAPPA